MSCAPDRLSRHHQLHRMQPLLHHEKPRRQTSGTHPGAAARNDTRRAVARAPSTFHSAPSSTLIEGAGHSHFQERSAAATDLRSAGTAPSSTTTTGTTDSRRQNQRATNVRRRAPPGSRQALTRIPPQPQRRPPAARPRSSRTFVDHFRASTRRQPPDCAAGLRTRSRTRRHDVIVLQLAPLLRPVAAGEPRARSRRPATTRRASRPSAGSPGDDADRLFRANRRAFTRIPSSQDDAFQQHDPKAAARQSRPGPLQ